MRGALLMSLLAVGLLPGVAAAQGTSGGIGSDNLEHVALVPLDGRANGAKLLGTTLYVTTGKTLEIFDVSAPESPRSIGRLAFEIVDGGYIATGYQEDVDTNGRVLIRSRGGEMQVVDVRDPAKPTILSTLAGADNHTMSCILDCSWVYGSEGTIVDLRDVARPVLADEEWTSAAEVGPGHDVTEVAPGIVLTATDPMTVLDARHDPIKPVLLATVEAPGGVHGTAWPGRGEGDIALAGGEILGPSPVCQDDPSATFHTWDTRDWRRTGTFRLLDEYRLRPTEQEGSTASVWCTHWFDHHPRFGRGGLVAIAWYEQGVRLLDVAGDGRIEQTGYFLPHGGSVWDVRWIGDRTVYTFDHHRGMDILRYTGDIPVRGGASPDAPAPAGPPPPASPRRPRFGEMVRLPRRCDARRALTLRVRRRDDDPVTSLVIRVGRAPVRRIRGAALARPVRVRKLPRRRFTLRVDVTTRSGASVSGKRRYAGCR